VKKAFLFMTLGIMLVIFSGVSFASDFRYCYLRALEQDPQLGAAGFSRKAAQERRNQVKARFFPTITGDIDWNNAWQDQTAYTRSLTTGNSNYPTQSYIAQLVQPLFHYDAFMEMSQANILVSRTDFEFESARQNMMLRVGEAYFGVLTTMTNLKNTETEEAAVQMHHEVADGKYRNGLIPVNDLQEARARLAAVQANKVDAQRDFDGAVLALMEIIGTSLIDFNPMKENIDFMNPDPEDPDKWVSTGLQKSMALQAKRLESEENKKEIDKQKAMHYPNIDVYGKWNRTDAAGSIYADGGGYLTNTSMIGAKMNIPIFSGGLTNARVKESVANYNKLLQDVKKEERNVIRQVRDSYQGLKGSVIRIAALKKSVESQKLVLYAREQGFKSGRNKSIEVLDAARDLNLYQKDYGKARYDYVTNYLRLKYWAGVLSEEDVNKVNEWVN
jgi:outer membrane protein